MNAKRVVFFAPSPSEPGGAQRRATLLAQALAGRGWDVLIVGRTAGGLRPRWHRNGRVTIVELPGFGKPRAGAVCYLIFGILLGLGAGLPARGYLALQLSSPTTAASVCGLLMHRPYVVMSSTSGLLSETSLLRGGIIGAIRRRLVSRSAAIVAQTDESAVELRTIFEHHRVVVVPNPVAAIAPPELNGLPLAAYSGRLSEEKDLPRLLDVWRQIASERPDAKLTLIGAGGFHRSIERGLRQRVRDNPALRRSVRFTGWVDDVAPTLSESDLFVFPSLSEGMSNSLLEACALGRVVVASDIAPNRAVLGDDYPLLFAAADSESMLTALTGALDDEGLRRRAHTSVLARAKLFSPGAMAEAIERLLGADRARHQ